MNRIIFTATIALSALGLTACGEKNATQSTTKMTNVEVVDGTISDDMILLDTSQGDGTSIDDSAKGGLYETVDNRPKPPANSSKRGDTPTTKSEDKGDADGDTPAIQPTAPAAPKASPAPAAPEPK